MSAIVPEVPMAVVGCDFRVASSAWRSRLVLSAAEADDLAEALRANGTTDGFADLNTCNRTEWIVSGFDAPWAATLLRSHMIARAGDGADRWFAPYVFQGDEAARHVFRVAMGRESLVVGERQIAGQFHDALERARTRGSSSRVLNGLGTVAGRLVRLAARRGCMGGASVGVHGLAAAYLASRFPGEGRVRVAVVGLGQIGRRVVNVLEPSGRFDVIQVNRTIAEGRAGRVRPLADLSDLICKVDAAVVCTGAHAPILVSGDLPARTADRPLVIIDIGIPEQVERAPLPANVRVDGLDELTAFHRATGRRAVTCQEDEPERLVERALNDLRAFCVQPVFSEILDSVQRNHAQTVREAIPRILAARLADVPEAVRTHLGQDLRAMLLEYTNDVFRTIRQAYGDGACACRTDDHDDL